MCDLAALVCRCVRPMSAIPIADGPLKDLVELAWLSVKDLGNPPEHTPIAEAMFKVGFLAALQFVGMEHPLVPAALQEAMKLVRTDPEDVRPGLRPNRVRRP